MVYFKPELLPTAAALDAIRGDKGVYDIDFITQNPFATNPAYEADE